MNNTTFKCCLDRYRLTAKPQYDGEISEIKNRIGRPYEVNSDNVKSFARIIASEGRSFCPATFKAVDNSDSTSVNKAFKYGLAREDNFDQMQVFAFEFNNDNHKKIVSFDEVKARADEYSLSILFAYHQFDSTPEHQRFTVIFLNDVPIKYARVAKLMLEALRVIFPESSPEITDITRVVLGGNSPLLYLDESMPTVNIWLIFQSMSLWLRDRYGDKHYKEHIYRFASKTGMSLNTNKILDISIIHRNTSDSLESSGESHESIHGDSSPNTIIYNIENGDKSPIYHSFYQIKMIDMSKSISSINSTIVNSPSLGTKRPKIHLPNRSQLLKKFGSTCQLFNEFSAGERLLSEDELTGLATNLIQIETGSDKFMKILKRHSYFDFKPKKYSDWQFHLNGLKKSNINPYPCDIFCHHKDTCHHARDTLSTIKPKRHCIQKLSNHPVEKFYPIEDARADFLEKFMTALNADDSNIHVINAPVGVGKSTIAMGVFESNTDLRGLFACSSNDLKNELFEKSEYMFPRVKSPSLYDKSIRNKLPPEIWTRIERLHQSGRYHETADYIKGIIATEAVDSKCREILDAYLKDLILFYKSMCNAFTTHSRLLTMAYWPLNKYDAVIIDEDILLHCMIPNQVEITFAECQNILSQIHPECDLAKKIRTAIDAAQSKQSFFTLKKIRYYREYDVITTAIDIASFCRAERFYFKKMYEENNLLESNQSADSIVFFRPFNLNPRVKYIVLSATANHDIYNNFFGADRLSFYQCKNIKNLGTLNQYSDSTKSRADIAKKPSVLKEVKAWTGVKHTVTFKKHADYINATMHFGKTTGVDFLRGKDLDVIGTPHQPEWIYKLFAYTMGHEIYDSDKLKYQPVQHNGTAFWFMTFERELLRNIQFWMIESELMQAVGRVRLPLEPNSTVNVFSNFPLPQAEFKKAGYSTRA